MEEKREEVQHIDAVEAAHQRNSHEAHVIPLQREAMEDARHVDLSWRSWIVVFFCCFAYVRPYHTAGICTHVVSASWRRCT
jgi:hypothetical protein